MMKKLILGLVTIIATLLLASCSKLTYTVSFNADGGTPVPEVQNIKKDGLVTLPSIEPTKEGFNFQYWMKDNVEYKFSNKVSSDFILKAKWEVKDENIVEPEYFTAVMGYDGQPDYFYRSETENNAADVGLDESIFSVTGTVIITNLSIGLNRLGGLRLYSEQNTGIGNTLMVSIAEGYEIAEVIFEFGEGNKYPKSGNLILGEQEIPLGAEDIKNTTLTKSDLAIKTFSLQNTHKSDASAQIWLSKVTIKYMVK